MTEGLLYEPRSFWSIANVALDGAEFIQTVRLPREHFFNGERWPIQIKRIALAAINYGFIEPPPGPLPGNPTAYHEGANNISVLDFAISVPQRWHVSSKSPAGAAVVTPRPRWEPRPRADAGAIVANSRASSLWGMSMLKCDKPLIIPEQGTIEWDLTSHSPWAVDVPNNETDALFIPGYSRATLLYQEVGGNVWPGSARTSPGPVGSFRPGFELRPFDRTRIAALPADPPEKWPFPPDATFDPAVVPLETGSTTFWNPDAHFGGRAFDAQESTRSGSTEISDLRCHIDQRFYDSAMQIAFNTPNQPSPLSLRTGSRIRTVNGGSNAWWWRPGAPLALTFDYHTPAVVYELKQEITLGPEEHLEVEVFVPPAFVEGQETREPSAYHLGISVNGYAAIEG